MANPTEPTQMMTAVPADGDAPSAPVDADALLADAARRNKVEQDLRRLGMTPDEVKRLLNADANSTDPLKRPSGAPASSPSAPGPLAPAIAPRGRAQRAASAS